MLLEARDRKLAALVEGKLHRRDRGARPRLSEPQGPTPALLRKSPRKATEELGARMNAK